MKIVDLEATTADLIPRHGRDGRPKIFWHCGECGGAKTVPSTKSSRMIKCPTCKGEGRVGDWYSRMTTFIDCLEDKSNLAQWKQRNAVIGMARRPGLMQAFSELSDPHGEDRSKAGALIQQAEEAADASLKATMGTALHDTYESINRGRPPGFIPGEYLADVNAYVLALNEAGIVPVAVETFVVNDDYRVGGTFDILGLHYEDGVGKCAPKLKIMDIKTGRIDYGFSKIAMQLGGYASAALYDPETLERKPITHTLEDGTVLEVDRTEALVIHAPSGAGVCDIVPADLTAAEVGLRLAWDVREWRKRKLDKPPIASVIGTASELPLGLVA